MFSQYGERLPTSGWDRLTSLGHPCTFQRVCRLDSVTARHSRSGRQPNFAALDRGCHLYSAGRPSRWALAHISSLWIHRFCQLSVCLSHLPEPTHQNLSIFSRKTLADLFRRSWSVCLRLSRVTRSIYGGLSYQPSPINQTYLAQTAHTSPITASASAASTQHWRCFVCSSVNTQATMNNDCLTRRELVGGLSLLL